MLGMGNKTPYEEWIEREGIPVIRGHYVEDIKTVPLAPWRRMGGSGVYLNMEGTDQLNDSYICEIPPGGALQPEKHLYEELTYVVQGRGATTVWNEGGPKQTFEWHSGSLFSPPLNAWHQHFNGSGSEPACFLAMTLAPMVLNLFASLDFVFDNPSIFADRYAGEQDYFSPKGKLYKREGKPGMVWESNFIADAKSHQLIEYQERGAGGRNIKFYLANNFMGAHISEFPVGTYKKAHRHGPGAHVIILAGVGFSLMWQEGEPIGRYDWREGSLIVPPEGWFHQHFNTGASPARYLALRPWGGKIRQPRKYSGTEDIKKGGDQIEYRDEDHAVRQMFEEALAKSGLESRMAPFYEKGEGRRERP